MRMQQYSSRGLLVSFLVMTLGLPTWFGCADDGRNRHGATCQASADCGSDLCITNLCVDPGSCRDLWLGGASDATLGPCAAALRAVEVVPAELSGGAGETFDLSLVGRFGLSDGATRTVDLTDLSQWDVEPAGLATVARATATTLSFLEGPPVSGTLTGTLELPDGPRSATARLTRIGEGPAETCGDGFLDITSEACDLSSSSGNACQWPTPDCTDECTCTNLCGNGQVDGVETCESTGDCDAGRVCRRCQCFLASIAVFVPDPSGDVVGPFELSLDIKRAELTLFGEGFKDLLVNIDATAGGSFETPTAVGRVCLIVADSVGAERLRACVVGESGTYRRLEVSLDGGPAEDWTEASGLRTTGPSAFTLAGWGLATPQRDWSWRLLTTLDGREVDRVPDTGEMAWTDIIGL